MTQTTFNLVDQPWIPCLTRDGRLVEVGLWDCLTYAHEIDDLAAETPLIHASLMNLLLALLHRNFGPSSLADWQALAQRGAFDAEVLRGYFERWYSRFDLFDPQRPFYQAEDKRVKQPKPMLHLLYSMGNSGTLFTHQHDEAPPRYSFPQAARQLVAAQAFHLAGLSGLSGQPFTDSIFARGMIFFAQGSSLFETLMLNLMAYPSDKLVPQAEDAEDLPAWEMDDPFIDRSLPYGYLDYLTWQSVRVKLLPTQAEAGPCVVQMTIGPGLRLSEAFSAPHKAYLKAKDNHEYSLRFSTSRAIWRDYEAMVSLQAEKQDSRLAAIVGWLSGLGQKGYIDRKARLRLRCLGMLADQAKIEFYRDYIMPLPAELLLDPQAMSILRQAKTQMEDAREGLRRAMYRLASLILKRDGSHDPDKNDVANLMSQLDWEGRYWQSLEAPFWELIGQHLDDPDQAAAFWEGTLRSVSQAVMGEVASSLGLSAGVLRAQAEAERELRIQLHRVFNPQAQVKGEKKS